MNNIETGKIGENIAYKYLLKNKYLILARNHRERFNEIDIIARSRDGTLIFCEVKTSNIDLNNETLNTGFMPEDNFSGAKSRKTIRACETCLARYPELLWENRGWQIDLIAIVLKNGKPVALRHYQNV